MTYHLLSFRLTNRVICKWVTAEVKNFVKLHPEGQLSQNMPNPVRTLATILHYQLKNETSIKISITATSKLFGTLEKLLHQALKGVHYESGSQKHRREDAAHAGLLLQ